MAIANRQHRAKFTFAMRCGHFFVGTIRQCLHKSCMPAVTGSADLRSMFCPLDLSL